MTDSIRKKAEMMVEDLMANGELPNDMSPEMKLIEIAKCEKWLSKLPRCRDHNFLNLW